MKHGLLLFLLSLLVTSCSTDGTLIVFSDPMLAEEAKMFCSTYEVKAGKETKLVELSSEVAAQNLRYGQPVDIWLMVQPELVDQLGVADKVERGHDLGSDAVVKAECISRKRAEDFRSAECWMKAASGTPLRNYTDAWTGTQGADSCIIIANFYSQVQEYMLRGWVKGGYVMESFAKAHKDQLRVLDKGPAIKPAYKAWKVNTGHHPEMADEFIELNDLD